MNNYPLFTPTNLNFKNVSDSKNVLYTATTNIYILKISVCNILENKEGITVTFQRVRNIAAADSESRTITKAIIKISQYNTCNLLKEINEDMLFLPKDDSIIIYTNGYQRRCDIDMDILTITELA